MPTLSKSKKKPAPSGEPEKIEMRYIPISEAVLTEANPKRHDLGGICQSIERYGFRNPPIWDKTLNDGAGGIAAGNGRTEALAAMEKQNRPVPRGIAVDDQGRWCMPVIFGCNADNQAEAIAFLIDDNNLGFGGDFSHWDVARNWEREGYIALLTSIADAEVVPVTVDLDTISVLLTGISGDNGDQSFGPEDSSTKEINPEDFELQHTCPKCGFEFDAKK